MLTGLSVEAKAVLGVFADFVGAKRNALFSAEFEVAPSVDILPQSGKTSSKTPPAELSDVGEKKLDEAYDEEEKSDESNADLDTNEPGKTPRLL